MMAVKLMAFIVLQTKKISNNLYHNITNLLIAIRRLMTNIRCKYSS